MNVLETLRAYGLFDARPPRYTSYPPASRFQPDITAKEVQGWIAAMPQGAEVSVYVHIPFCRRLCWFCAYRTQGVRSRNVVRAYVDCLITELQHISALLPDGVRMARLHLGGGTPTVLAAPLTDHLLGQIFHRIPPHPDIVFSAEIDPTDCPDDVLDCLGDWRLKSATVGVQDIDPLVQASIGRRQSPAATASLVRALRARGVGNLTVDLLYGLPHQSHASLGATLGHALKLRPDRMALYGYAHVPHMSKRQSMIPAAALPGREERFHLSESVRYRIMARGFMPVGTNHFARPRDTLAAAAQTGRLRRGFQGYTDDPYEVLLGFGASAISAFPQGYAQNAMSTGAYCERIRHDGCATQRGFRMSARDRQIAAMISDLMCYGRIDLGPDAAPFTKALSAVTASEFPRALDFDQNALRIRNGYRGLTRVLCAWIDNKHLENGNHQRAAL